MMKMMKNLSFFFFLTNARYEAENWICQQLEATIETRLMSMSSHNLDIRLNCGANHHKTIENSINFHLLILYEVRNRNLMTIIFKLQNIKSRFSSRDVMPISCLAAYICRPSVALFERFQCGFIWIWYELNYIFCFMCIFGRNIMP